MLTIIESPFKPSDDDVEHYAGQYTYAELMRHNIQYARMLLADALERGDAPFASHLLYTQVWSESVELRSAGIAAGLEWSHAAEQIVFGVDLGISSGMRAARDNASLINVTTIDRCLFVDMKTDAVRAYLHALTFQAFAALT